MPMTNAEVDATLHKFMEPEDAEHQHDWGQLGESWEYRDVDGVWRGKRWSCLVCGRMTCTFREKESASARARVYPLPPSPDLPVPPPYADFNLLLASDGVVAKLAALLDGTCELSLSLRAKITGLCYRRQIWELWKDGPAAFARELAELVREIGKA